MPPDRYGVHRMDEPLGRRARTALFTLLALVSFAANSWLCRGALRGGSIDPGSFTALRLLTGALVLLLVVRATAWRMTGGDGASPPAGRGAGSWTGAFALFAYAIAFSLAYVRLDTGVGALALFGAVQLTLLVAGMLLGHRLSAGDLAGATLALGGLLALAAPGGRGADPLAVAGMALAGVAWGLYTLRGRSASRPLVANAGNFLRAAPLALVALVLLATTLPARLPIHVSPLGLALAALSGGVTSGLGYAAWYAALPGLVPVHAGLVQLAVPVLAALGGALFLGERPSLRLLMASAAILGGIALALLAPRRSRPAAQRKR